MSKHITEELPRLLTGDATHDVVMEAAEHLRTCPDCQQELVSAVVSHASLMSAHRFAPEVVAPVPTGEPSLARVASIHDGPGHDEPEDQIDDDLPLPDMSDMFARVRAEADSGAARRGIRTRRSLLSVAAAAVVLIGGGVAVGYAVEGGNSGKQVSLGPFEEGHASATATIKGNTIVLDASSLPKLSAARYEVWLTDTKRTKMYSIGFLDDGSHAAFTVKHDQLEKFSDIEVSLQPKGKLPYSGTSVLRGSYASNTPT